LALGLPAIGRARLCVTGCCRSWGSFACARGSRDPARQQNCSLSLEARARERQGLRPERKAGAAATELDPGERALWEALRAWRLEEARRQELPPYVIFHDSTLIEIARRRPVALSALADIPGIGRSKLERYGSAVVGIVAQKTTQPTASTALNETLT
jgi:ATP-dependent DNA helicase RecQ